MSVRQAFAAILLAAISAGPSDAGAETQPPVVYARKTGEVDLTLRIDPALKRFAGVYAGYRDGALRDFNAFERQADKVKAIERRTPGGPHTGPMVERVEVTVSAETPHLIGVIRRSYVDLHGAHSSYGVQGFIIDRASGRPMEARELLQPDADLEGLDRRLNAAADAQRTARDGADDHISPSSWTYGLTPDRSSNPNARPTIGVATLVASTTAERAAGVQFLYPPCDIGSCASGAYRTIVPLADFTAMLRPQYRDDFAGSPVSLDGDPLRGFPGDAPR